MAKLSLENFANRMLISADLAAHRPIQNSRLASTDRFHNIAASVGLPPTFGEKGPRSEARLALPGIVVGKPHAATEVMARVSASGRRR